MGNYASTKVLSTQKKLAQAEFAEGNGVAFFASGEPVGWFSSRIFYLGGNNRLTGRIDGWKPHEKIFRLNGKPGRSEGKDNKLGIETKKRGETPWPTQINQLQPKKRHSGC